MDTKEAQRLQREGRCAEYVMPDRSFHGHYCGRPVKGEGLCGIHLRAVIKSREDRERWERERKESNSAQAQASAAARRIADAYGVPVGEFRPEYDRKAGKHTGGLVLSPAAVEALLRAL